MAMMTLRKFVSVSIPAPTFAQIRDWLKKNEYVRVNSIIPYYGYPKMSYWRKSVVRNGKKLTWTVQYPCVSRHPKFAQLMGQFISECAMREGLSGDELYNIIVNEE